MLPFDPTMARQQAQDNWLDPNSLNRVKAMGRDGDPEALREVARQFEAMFLQQMLKSMRSANEVFGEDGLFDSSETRFYQDLLDQQMSLTLSAGQGMGLADAIYRQLQHSYGDYLPQRDSEAALYPTPVGPPAPNAAARTPASQTPAGDIAGVNAVAKPSRESKGGKTAMVDSPREFVQRLLPLARRAAALLGVNADVLLAQAALETGWGRHVIHDSEGGSSFNLFNIKADRRWSGDSINVATLEYRGDTAQREQANFRRYNSYAESFLDYVRFISGNPRYQEALAAGRDSAAYAQALQDAGYATDPRYADKLQRVLNSDALRDIPGQSVASAGHTSGRY